MLDSGAKSFDDVTNAADLFEFVLQLVDLAEDFVHSSYFGVCDGHRIAGAVILQLRCSFALLIKLLGAKNGDNAVQVSRHGLLGSPDAFYYILAVSRTRDLASRNRRALGGRESRKERLMGTYHCPALLDCCHDTVKVLAEALQTPRIQQQPTLAGGIAGGARAVSSGMLSSKRLVLAESLDVGRGKT